MTNEEYVEYLKHVGKLAFWDEKPFLDAASILVAADEPMRAIQLLDNLPGYYRDNIPPAIKKMKEEIYHLLATPHFYINNVHDRNIDLSRGEESLRTLLRGQLIAMDVANYNKEGITPHIVDLGPGEYWLAIGLMRTGHKFTYQGIGLCSDAEKSAREVLGGFVIDHTPKDVPVIYVACEIIEHLHHENDIAVELHRNGATPAIIHISTPKYTFDCRQERLNWRAYGDLGHLRTYTPNDFMSVVCKMFPGYVFQYYDSQIMHLRGTLNVS